MSRFRVTVQAPLPKDMVERKRLQGVRAKEAQSIRREKLKRAAYDGMTPKELKHVRKCKREGVTPRLGSNPSGGSWGL